VRKLLKEMALGGHLQTFPGMFHHPGFPPVHPSAMSPSFQTIMRRSVYTLYTAVIAVLNHFILLSEEVVDSIIMLCE